ncbi:MAG: hypothetical protein HWD85_09655 [Flavobacteriaceae bacterium]|nr:hypothetical protein [Flavobacteriaceae bacterium]
MENIRAAILLVFLVLSQINYGQQENCLTNYKKDLDQLLPVKLIKEYSQQYELDHYIIGSGTDYVETQFFWYLNDETTYHVKLYGLKKVTSKAPIEKFKRKVERKTDRIYKYEYAKGVRDYAYWTTSNMDLKSATTTDATLTVLYKKERFVVQVNVETYKKSQEIAINLAKQIIKKCKK